MCKIGSSLWTNASIVLILFHCNVRVVSSIFITQASLNIYELYSSCNMVVLLRYMETAWITLLSTTPASSLYSEYAGCPQKRHAGTLHQQNPPVLNWRCRLTQVDFAMAVNRLL